MIFTRNIIAHRRVKPVAWRLRERFRKTIYRVLITGGIALIFAMVARASGPIYSNPVPIVTLAGMQGNPGYANGTGTAAQFKIQEGITIDSSSRIFVADGGNNVIRMVTPWGAVTTIAGTGVLGPIVNGPGTTAQFSGPQAVAADNSGTLYVADSNNNAIRKIVFAGGTWMVSTFALGFNQPDGVAVSSSGAIYVADTGNNQVVKLHPNGSVWQTFNTNNFNHPVGLASDNAGNIYVADAGNNQIKKITNSGAVSVLANIAGAQGNDDYPVSSATFHTPRGVAVDSIGNVYVADTGNYTLREISSGNVTTLAGQVATYGFANGAGQQVKFSGLGGVAIDNSSGVIYISDTDNHIIRATKLVQPPPKLTKVFSPSLITPGQAVDVIFTITNTPGNPAQTGLGFLDSLPNPPFNAGGSVTNNTCGGFATVVGPGAVSLANGAMAAGTSQCTITFHMNPPRGCGPYTNTGIQNVHNTNLDTSGVNATLNINCAATLDKKFVPTLINLGQPTDITFTLTNPAGAPALSGLAFSDLLPFPITAGSMTGNTCGGIATVSGNTVSLANGNLAAGVSTCTLTFHVTPKVCGYFNNNSPNISNVQGLDTSHVLSHLQVTCPPTITKAFQPAVVNLGQPVDIVITLTNPAGNPPQTGLGFVDTLPSPPFTMGTVGNNGCNGTPNVSGHTISLVNASLPAGPSQCQVVYHMSPMTGCGTFHNTAQNLGNISNLDDSNFNAALTVNCPLVRVGLEKIVESCPANYSGTFNFNVTCTPPGGPPTTSTPSITVNASDPLVPFHNLHAKEHTIILGMMPVGTVCSATETGPMPPPPGGCTWDPPTYDPSSGSITASSGGQNVIGVINHLNCPYPRESPSPSPKRAGDLDQHVESGNSHITSTPSATPKTRGCWVCIGGKVSQIPQALARSRHLQCYGSEEEARTHCKVWCCMDGQVVQVTEEECRARGGQGYGSRKEALRHCGHEGPTPRPDFTPRLEPTPPPHFTPRPEQTPRPHLTPRGKNPNGDNPSPRGTPSKKTRPTPTPSEPE